MGQKNHYLWSVSTYGCHDGYSQGIRIWMDEMGSKPDNVAGPGLKQE